MPEAIRSRLVLLALYPLFAVIALIALVRTAFAILASPQRGWKLATAFDQLLNTAGNGDPDETVSSRAAKARMAGRRWGCVLCRVLDSLDTDHCLRFLERDRGGKV